VLSAICTVISKARKGVFKNRRPDLFSMISMPPDTTSLYRVNRRYSSGLTASFIILNRITHVSLPEDCLLLPVFSSSEAVFERRYKGELRELKPAIIKDRKMHGASTSQVSEGAAAVLLARRDVVERLGMLVRGKFAVTARVPLKIMGIEPAYGLSDFHHLLT
ncbi:3-ketoacyl-CoA thiolase, peroxisomal, partial [Termitomyces sp. J132]